MSDQKLLQRALDHCITDTRSKALPEPYRGKVREVYRLTADRLAIVVTDRVSAFDYILPEAIPFKGQILNRLAEFFLRRADTIMPTHLLEVPHPNISLVRECNPLPVEVVVRGYLAGHAWRLYRDGHRQICGIPLPEGMLPNQRFDEPILTPTTKAVEGHDEDISEQQILQQGLITEDLWQQIREKAFALFEQGSRIAEQRGLLLVDTKYEFGLYNGELMLIDEVHTPDSSRYFYADSYEQKLKNREKQHQLSKEFVREWLMEQGFQGGEGEQLPELSDEFRIQVYRRYAELYEKLAGEPFEPEPVEAFHKNLAALLAGQVRESWSQSH